MVTCKYILHLGLVTGSLILSLTSFAGGTGKKSDTVKVMSYNVENLFDTEHDEGKSDWEFLPKSHPLKNEGCKTVAYPFRRSCFETDWTAERLQLKLQQINNSVLSLGALPDVLALTEVENKPVVEKLAQVMGYKGVILEEGSDGRGIDVALMYNENNLNYLGHQVRSPNDGVQGRPTRDILAVYFSLKADRSQNVLAVYVNHWPSQASPAEKRYFVAEKLKAFMEEDRQKYGDSYHALAVGDFNTIDQDWPHPHNGVLLNKDWPNHLIDGLSQKPKDPNFPLGSYFYYVKTDWNYLDRIFMTQNLLDERGLEVVRKSFSVGRSDFNSFTYEYNDSRYQQHGSRITGVPRPYNHNTSDTQKAGVSDHFPVSIEVKVR